jgi:PAS domain S-box-containing protein
LFFEYQNSEGERYLDLVASYACDKRRFVATRILEGEGLLGQCMIEQDFIFIKDVPHNYVKINSGLGGATPKAITVAPLVFNQKFYGIIEMASFEALQPHQIEFLKKVCENIASEISALKNVEHTKTLLDESTLMAKELKLREEEMKQNMEELTATQEEMARKQVELSNTIKEAERSQQELISYLSGIDNTIASAEFTLDGKFKNANEIFLKISGFQKEELADKDYNFLMGEDQTITMMWENLLLGKFFSGEFKMKDKNGRELWLSGTFNPITIEGNVPEKIMMFAQFTTQEKEKLNDLTSMVQALKATLPVIEFSQNFVCKSANEKALQLFGLSRMQLRSKTILDFIAPDYHTMWNDRKDEILSADFSNFVIPFYADSQILSYEGSISLTRNLEGEVTKIIFLLTRTIEDKVQLLAVG